MKIVKKVSIKRIFKELKQKYLERLLLFQTGNFYEAFFEDAKNYSRVIGINYFVRKVDGFKVPAVRMPSQRITSCLRKLTKAGYKIVLFNNKNGKLHACIYESKK